MAEDKMETESESSSDEEEKEWEKRAEELEKQINENKYLYDAHVELVGLYRKLTDLQSLRASYNVFKEVFPLTPTLWLEWIKDEMKIANTSEEKEKILQLFENAVDDYLSVDLWQEYAQYSIGFCSLEKTREILKKGLSAVGLHVSKGSLLWDTLREFELAHLSLYEQNSEQYKQQLLKVADVFKRQLCVPLLDMESTYNEFKIWIDMLPSDHGIDLTPIEWGYKKALKTLEGYKDFEGRLLVAEDESSVLQIYKEYITASKDPSFIICLYERAVSQYCLNPNLWEEYLLHCIKLGDVAVSVSARALRNCPWSEDLWVMRLRIFEHQKVEEKKVLECFEQGISSIAPSPGLELWLTYLEYAHRNFNDQEKLNKLFEQANQSLWGQFDPTCKIGRLQARLLAKHGDMEAARKLWGDIAHTLGRNSANTWRELAELEKQYGKPQNIRALYQKALNLTTDYPLCIAEDWLMYEREYGTLDDVLKCLDKVKFLKAAVTQDQQEEHNKYNAEIRKSSKKRQHDRDENYGGNKRFKPNYEEQSNKVKGRKEKNVQKESHEDEQTQILRNKYPDRVQGTPPDLDHERTVFVSNLQYDVVEEHLQEMFPKATKINLAIDRKGVSRCYAYIRFETPEEVDENLKRDREPLNGRPTFISRCKPDRNQRETVFKYSTAPETNKLFLKNLPHSTTQEDLDKIYKPYGVVSVRIVAHKSGQSKGIAYVEFPDEESANKALEGTKSLQIEDREIFVAISAPPSKKFGAELPKPFEPTRHSRTRLQTAFIPRGVQLKAKQSVGETAPIKEGNGTPKVMAKTNEEFRKMLLNK